MGGEKLNLNISNKYSIIGLILGILSPFLLIYYGILLIIVVAVIIYFVTDKSMDDTLNFLIFGVIGFIIGMAIFLFVLPAIFG